jgi:hypothetical protein
MSLMVSRRVTVSDQAMLDGSTMFETLIADRTSGTKRRSHRDWSGHRHDLVRRSVVAVLVMVTLDVMGRHSGRRQQE